MGVPGILRKTAMSRQQALVLCIFLAGALYYWWRSQHHEESSRSSAGSILDKYTLDLTAEAKAGNLDAVIGREEETERVIHILSRRTKNNPLLIGEPGVGKTAVVEGIALAIVRGDVPEHTKGKRVLSLDLGALIGGTKYRGEFEERMKKLTEEIKAGGRSIILFIDEIHMVEQAKGAEGAINVSDILKPALARGDLQLVGATTWKEYEQYIKPDDALNRRLQPVVIGEPSEDACIHILQGIKEQYEVHHQVTYSPKAIKAAVDLSRQYIHDRFLPDKAIDLIDEAGAKVAIEASRGVRHAFGLLHAAGMSVQERIAGLEEEKVRLQEEIAHMRRLEEKTHGDVSLIDVEKKLESLVASLAQVQHALEKHKGSEVPEVHESDIQEVVNEWVGKSREKKA